MRIALISDTHGKTPAIPKCDLIIHAGDVCPNFRGGRDMDRLAQARWMDVHLRAWLEYHPPVIATGGNHDFVLQRSELVPKLPWTLLMDQATEFRGLKIYGTPWSLRFFDWAFMASEENLESVFAQIPEGLDILIVHGPPNGWGDLDKTAPYLGNPNMGENAGSIALRNHIERAQPKIVVFGHIHEARGHTQIQMPNGTVDLYNASAVDLSYSLYEPPYFMIDI